MCWLSESCRCMPFCHVYLQGKETKKDKTRWTKQVFERQQEINYFLFFQTSLVMTAESRFVGNSPERKGRQCKGKRIREPPKLPKPPNHAAFLELDPSLVNHLRAEKQICASENWETHRKRNNEQVSAIQEKRAKLTEHKSTSKVDEGGVLAKAEEWERDCQEKSLESQRSCVPVTTKQWACSLSPFNEVNIKREEIGYQYVDQKREEGNENKDFATVRRLSIFLLFYPRKSFLTNIFEVYCQTSCSV